MVSKKRNLTKRTEKPKAAEEQKALSGADFENRGLWSRRWQALRRAGKKTVTFQTNSGRRTSAETYHHKFNPTQRREQERVNTSESSQSSSDSSSTVDESPTSRRKVIGPGIAGSSSASEIRPMDFDRYGVAHGLAAQREEGECVDIDEKMAARKEQFQPHPPQPQHQQSPTSVSTDIKTTFTQESSTKWNRPVLVQVESEDEGHEHRQALRPERSLRSPSNSGHQSLLDGVASIEHWYQLHGNHESPTPRGMKFETTGELQPYTPQTQRIWDANSHVSSAAEQTPLPFSTTSCLYATSGRIEPTLHGLPFQTPASSRPYMQMAHANKQRNRYSTIPCCAAYESALLLSAPIIPVQHNVKVFVEEEGDEEGDEDEEDEEEGEEDDEREECEEEEQEAQQIDGDMRDNQGVHLSESYTPVESMDDSHLAAPSEYQYYAPFSLNTRRGTIPQDTLNFRHQMLRNAGSGNSRISELPRSCSYCPYPSSFCQSPRDESLPEGYMLYRIYDCFPRPGGIYSVPVGNLQQMSRPTPYVVPPCTSHISDYYSPTYPSTYGHPSTMTSVPYVDRPFVNPPVAHQQYSTAHPFIMPPEPWSHSQRHFSPMSNAPEQIPPRCVVPLSDEEETVPTVQGRAEQLATSLLAAPPQNVQRCEPRPRAPRPGDRLYLPAEARQSVVADTAAGQRSVAGGFSAVDGPPDGRLAVGLRSAATRLPFSVGRAAPRELLASVELPAVGRSSSTTRSSNAVRCPPIVGCLAAGSSLMVAGRAAGTGIVAPLGRPPVEVRPVGLGRPVDEARQDAGGLPVVGDRPPVRTYTPGEILPAAGVRAPLGGYEVFDRPQAVEIVFPSEYRVVLERDSAGVYPMVEELPRVEYSVVVAPRGEEHFRVPKPPTLGQHDSTAPQLNSREDALRDDPRVMTVNAQVFNLYPQ